MRPALKAALDRVRALLLAAAAGGASQLAGHAEAAVNLAEQSVISAAEQKTWAQAQAKKTVEAYQRYLELFPTGQFAEEAFRSLIERSFKGPSVRSLVVIRPAIPPAAGQPGRPARTIQAVKLDMY